MESYSFTGNAVSVLLIEDDSMHASLIEMVLNEAGLSVQIASTPQEAMNSLEHMIPDVILAAWDWDGLDGRTLALQIKRRFSMAAQVPLLLMTDRVVPEKTRLELSAQGIHWILEKPLVVTSLPKLVGRTVSECRRTRMEGNGFRPRPLGQVVNFGQTASGAFQAVCV